MEMSTTNELIGRNIMNLDINRLQQLGLSYETASRLQKNISQSSLLMTPKSKWMQTIPTNCDVVMTFPANSDDSIAQWLSARLRSKYPGLTATVHLHSSTKCPAIYVTVSQTLLVKAAEELHLPKQLRPELGGGLKEFNCKDAASFLHFVDRPEKFFTSQERQSLTLHLLNGLTSSKEDCERLSRCCNRNLREGQSIIPLVLSLGVIKQVFPLHDPRKIRKLTKIWVKSFFHRQPLDEISEYFGLQIGFYFAWLGYYTLFLCISSAVGFIMWVCLYGRSPVIQDCGIVLFALFNVLWASFYLECWKRRSHELAYNWGSLDQRGDLLEEPRPLFKGPLKESPITGRMEPHYPEWKRKLTRYLISLPVISLSLGVSVLSMWTILQFQNWFDKRTSNWKFFSFVSYGPKVALAIVVTIYNSVFSSVAIWLNNLENYRLETEFQNHLIFRISLFQFVNSFLSLFYIAFYLEDMDRLKEQLAALLITRQVLGNIFESGLPYLIKELKLADICLRQESSEEKSTDSDETADTEPVDDSTGPLLTEDPHPLSRPSISSNKAASDTSDLDILTGKKDSLGGENRRTVRQAEAESILQPYDDGFDDHLEMFIQFGYVILFSSAFPLAATCALINNLIEIRSDAFKLCHTLQRPFGHRVKSIGMWQNAMAALGILSVIVNCALICQSGLIQRLIPGLTKSETIILLVVLEHLLFFFLAVVYKQFPDIPTWVKTEMAKVEFRRREAFRLNNFGRSFSTSPPSLKREVSSSQRDSCSEESVASADGEAEIPFEIMQEDILRNEFHLNQSELATISEMPSPNQESNVNVWLRGRGALKKKSSDSSGSEVSPSRSRAATIQGNDNNVGQRTSSSNGTTMRLTHRDRAHSDSIVQDGNFAVLKRHSEAGAVTHRTGELAHLFERRRNASMSNKPPDENRGHDEQHPHHHTSKDALHSAPTTGEPRSASFFTFSPARTPQHEKRSLLSGRDFRLSLDIKAVGRNRVRTSSAGDSVEEQTPLQSGLSNSEGRVAGVSGSPPGAAQAQAIASKDDASRSDSASSKASDDSTKKLIKDPKKGLLKRARSAAIFSGVVGGGGGSGGGKPAKDKEEVKSMKEKKFFDKWRSIRAARSTAAGQQQSHQVKGGQKQNYPSPSPSQWMSEDVCGGELSLVPLEMLVSIDDIRNARPHNIRPSNQYHQTP